MIKHDTHGPRPTRLLLALSPSLHSAAAVRTAVLRALLCRALLLHVSCSPLLATAVQTHLVSHPAATAFAAPTPLSGNSLERLCTGPCLRLRSSTLVYVHPRSGSVSLLLSPATPVLLPTFAPEENRGTDESRRVSVVVPRPLLTMQPLQSSNSWLIAVAMVVVCRLSNYPPNVRKDMPNNTPPLFSSFFPPLPVMCVSGGPTTQSVQVRSSGCSQPRSAARIASASQCNGSYHSR